MTLKNLLTVSSVLAFLFGLAFLLFPYETTNLYGYTLTADTSYIPRYFGATLLGFGVVNWLAREAVPEGAAIRAIVIGNLATTAIGLVVSVLNAVNLRGNGLVWINVVIYAGLAAGFGYLQLAKRSTTTTTRMSTPGSPIPH